MGKEAPLSTRHRKWIRSLHHKSVREKEGVFIAEGFNALEAAVETTAHPIVEVMTDRTHREMAAALLPGAVPVYECSDSVLKELSTEKTPQGIVMVCRRKGFDFEGSVKAASATLLYLDRISDPGNLGTIIRTAAWFGIEQLILSPSCVDPFNTKAIRASAGAIFKTKVYRSVDFEQIQRFAGNMGFRMVAMVPRGGDSPDALQKVDRTIVMLGQEAGGLSEELARGADQLITIPGRGKVESLNLSIAAGIILYAITSERTGRLV